MKMNVCFRYVWTTGTYELSVIAKCHDSISRRLCSATKTIDMFRGMKMNMKVIN
jgi:hypothetical protein